MRKYYSNRLLNLNHQLLLWLMVFGVFSAKAQVSVTATAGVATGTYTTVSQAFDSINRGRHQGVVDITITANTTEPGAPVALLKPNVTGGYTSVTIRPQGVRTIGLSSLNANRGILELFGARDVTIDGDDPAIAGIDRSLTIGFNGATAWLNRSVIRIGSVVTPSDSAVNITIKNCNLIGPRPSSTNIDASFGVFIGNNNTGTMGLGIRNRNISIENNIILKCYIGIASYGNTAAQAYSNISILSNQIGITSIANDLVGQTGVDLLNSSATTGPLRVERNLIQVGPGTSSSSGISDASIGIWVDNGNPNANIAYNTIQNIINNTSSFVDIAGIVVEGAGSTDVNVNNNIIKDVVSARKQTTFFNPANYGFIGRNGSSFKFNHNSVALNLPNYIGTTSNAISSALFVTSTLQELNNNILVNRNGSSNAFCIMLNNINNIASAVMDKNCYFAPNGSIANTAPSTLPTWQSITGREQNSFIENPPFVSANDLHIQTGVVTLLESNATPSGYAFDVDLQQRNNPVNDIGADEFAGTAYIAPQILSVSHSPTTQSCATATARTVSALFINPGGLGNALDSVMVEFSFNGGANQYLRMNSVSATGFTRLLPLATPLNAIVKYRVLAITKVGDTVSSNYFYYNDNTASRALMPVLSSDPPQACVTSTVQLNYRFNPDPTGFIFPPNVIDTVMRTNITNVKLTTINNTTPDSNSLVGSIGTATGVRGAYSNFRSFAVDTVGLGRSYPVSVTGTTVANVKLYFAAFVDFDGDGSFTSANEMVFNTVQARTSGTRTENFSLYIPPNARPGKTCIRFICSHTPITNSFFNILRGEVEDYSIFIRPLATVWKAGATTIGANNPQAYTIAALPAPVYIEMTDSASCTVASNPLSITASTGGLNVTLTAPFSSCYNSPATVRANVTGGCPPYTYSWSNNASLNAATQILTVVNDTVFLTVTVTDKNGSQYSRTGFIRPNNPRLDSLVDTVIICNRGSAIIGVKTRPQDSAYWYQSAAANPYNPDFMGKVYTTPTLNSTKDFYVAALRSSADSVGKMNNTGTPITTGVMPINAGLLLDVNEPVIIRDCQMYLTGNAGATVSIALIDKYGSIVAELNNYALSPVPININTPTRIPLNFALPTVDTGYRLILTNFTNLTGLTRNTTATGFPYTATKPITVRKAYNIANPADGDYLYFYNIRVLRGICVGQKDTVTAKVTPPDVPGLYEDLKYTLLCKDDTLNIKVSTKQGTDTLGNRFVWSRNGIVLQNFSVNPPSDTFNDSFYRVPISSPSDTGLYQVKIFSTRFCTRDTFSREVRVSFHKEPEIIANLSPINMCLNKNTKLTSVFKNASLFKWYKDTVNLISTADTTKSEYDIINASFSETGIYHVVATDSNKCRDVKSSMVKVTVHDNPVFVTHPMDTVICVGQRYVIKTKTNHALSYQWFKDNGIMNNFIKDSLTLFSSLITDSGSYRLVASSYPGCSDAVSNPAKLIVNPSPIIQGFYPAQLKFCEGQKLKITASAANRKEIEWYRGGSLITVQDSVVVANSGLSNAGKYSFIVKALNKCTDLKSDTIDVKVFKKPIVTGSRADFIECQDTSFKFGFSTTNGNIYQWYRNGIALQSQIDSQLNLPFLSFKDTGTYNVRVNSDPVCPDTGSNSFRIIIRPKPEFVLQPVDQTIACMGETVQLVANSFHGIGFQWIKDGSIIPGATNNTLVINNLAGSNSGRYWLRITGQAPCKNIISDTAIVLHRSGQSNAAVSLVSVYNIEEQCTDGDNWTYYATKQEPNKYLFAVNKKGNSIIGTADIVVRPNTFVSVNNTGKEFTSSLMLKRFWNYKLISGTINNPIDVKFYVNQSELDELDDKKDEIKNLYGDQLALQNSSVGWFKTKDVPFTNALLGGVRGNRFYFDSVVIGQYIDGTENGVKYIAFQDIANIGGGTAYYMFKGGTRYLGSIQTGSKAIYAEVSPNPNNGQFNLYIASKTLGKVNLVLVNNLGQTVYNDELRLNSLDSEFPMMIPNLANGLYQLILSKDDFNTSIKLQIEK